MIGLTGIKVAAHQFLAVKVCAIMYHELCEVLYHKVREARIICFETSPFPS